MKATESIKREIKAWEGLRLEAYRCAAGVFTIGYGHTGHDVTETTKITEAQAEILFNHDVAELEQAVEVMARTAGVVLSQGQFDALVSFVFNVGIGAFRKSTLWRMVVGNPEDERIGGEFVRWVKVNGRYFEPLALRRKRECEVYFSK